jgi:hypothetical protein
MGEIMPEKSILGVDCGKTGAIAIIGYGGPKVVDLPYIGDEVDVRGLGVQCIEWGVLSGSLIAIEYQVAFSAPGRKMGATSAFNLGEGFGMLKAFAYFYGLRVVLPRPAAWKKHFGLIGKDKDASRLLASQLFPGVDLHLVKHHGRAEALLLAEWARVQP